MDFLDTNKQRRHAILLYIGYAFIALAIAIATMVLVYQANGFGVNRKGQIVQNGLVFFSSQPAAADIYLNGVKQGNQTNTRVSVASGQYTIKISRDGYRDWTRPLNVQGGDVQNFDYPFLFPAKLDATTYATLEQAPGLTSQSRDRRWLLAQESSTSASFALYDLKNPKDPAVTLALPATVAGSAASAHAWEVVQWANNNRHVLLKHTSNNVSQFVLLDTQDVAQSRNLTNEFKLPHATMALIDNTHNRYHVFDAASGRLFTAALDNETLTEQLTGVIAYKSYGTKSVVYVTATDASEGKVRVMLYNGEKSYPIREVAANTTYLLDMAGYDGAPYVALGAASDNAVYVYKDPVAQFKDEKLVFPNAARVLKIQNPTWMAFSPNTQYVVAQGGTQFGVYDIYLKHAYVYALQQPLDAPQQQARWMDGNRLMYVSGGKLLAFDYDRRNQQALMAASAAHSVAFSPDYKYVYSINPEQPTQILQTPLRTPNDL